MKKRNFQYIFIILFAVACLISVFFIIKLNLFKNLSIFINNSLNNDQASITSKNKTFETQTYENDFLTIKYPHGWYNIGIYIQNYEPSNFISYKDESERMKKIKDPLRIMIGQGIVPEEQKVLPIEKNIEKSFQWIELVKNNLKSKSIVIENEDNIIIDGKAGKSFYVRHLKDPSYESGIYPGFLVEQEIYIPLEKVVVNITIYGDIQSNQKGIDSILKSTKFKSK